MSALPRRRSASWARTRLFELGCVLWRRGRRTATGAAAVARGPLLPALPAAIETPEARLLELGCRVGLPLAVWLLVLSTGCLTAANALTPTWVSTRVTPVYRHSCSHVQWLTLVLTLLTPVYVT